MRQPLPDEIDDPRRRFLIRALATGLYATGIGASGRAAAEFLGRKPEQLKPGQSIYRVEGQVLVNGRPADQTTPITANDRVETGKDAQAIFVVGQDAFMLRENSQLHLSGKAKFQQRLGSQKTALAPPPTTTDQPPNLPAAGLVDSFQLVTGGLLTVFGRTEHQARTSTASIGIRGTGVYFESEPDRSYVCTCYGSTDIVALDDPGSRASVISRHHDAPKYILKAGAAGEKVIKAPFKNHGDLELMLLEELVGRAPPFSVSADHYSVPRRGY